MQSTEGGWPALALSLLYKFGVLKWSSSTFTIPPLPLSLNSPGFHRRQGVLMLLPRAFWQLLVSFIKTQTLSCKDAETVRQPAWTSLKESSHTYQARQSWGNTSAFQTQRQPRHYPCGMTQWLIPHSVWPRTGYLFMNCAESSVRGSVLCAAFGTSFCDWFLHSAASLLCDLGSMLTLFKQDFWGFTWKGDNAICAIIILLGWARRSSWWEVGALSRQKVLL